jgi:peptide/nickel transport system substrate-binding protein
MALHKKQLRYYWWIVLEFTKKNARLLLLSFFISVIVIVSLMTLAPYLINVTTYPTQVVGITGISDINSVPDSILSKISNGLIYIDQKGQIVPILADHWEVSRDGKEYKFYLKKDLFWNDTKKFSAKDINYGFKDVEIVVPNDYEIDFKLKNKLPIFPTYLTKPIIRSPLIGVAGLYKVDRKKIKFGNVYELYLTPTKPNFPALTYKFYENESKMVDAYKSGQIKEMTTNKKSVADLFQDWKNTKINKEVDYSQVVTLFFNMNSPNLAQKDRKELRQAIAMLLSQMDISTSGEPANGPIPPISWAYNANAHQSTYNEEFVQKILKSGDLSKKTTMNLYTYQDYLDVSDKLVELFGDTNIKINVNVLQYEKPDSFDMFLASWRVPSDPDQYYFWHSSQTQYNITGYKSEKIDKLLEDGRATGNIDERMRIYSNFQKVIDDDAPAYFFYYPYIYTIHRK